SREAFDAVVEEAGARGLPVVGHIPRNFDPAHSLGGGLDLVAHAEEFFFTVFGGPRSTSDLDRSYRPDRSLIPGLIELLVGSGVFVIPNLSFSYGIQVMWDGMENVWEDPELAYLAPATVDQWRSGNIDRRVDLANFVFRDRLKYDLMQELTLRFQEAGVPMLLGTDAAAPTLFPGRSAHRELRELVKAGLTHAEALRVGTRNAGDFAALHLRDEERFGRVAVGYRADLVLVDGDPLDDVRNAARISGVMVRGRWLERAEIDALRAALADGYAGGGAGELVDPSFADVLDR
ncbi:MAG TPA: amidohydrolase family protein, partial [Longimicrobiales bacterium]|nr:amidohydrolase family protein [Longimicrobiales bacterium]